MPDWHWTGCIVALAFGAQSSVALAQQSGDSPFQPPSVGDPSPIGPRIIPGYREIPLPAPEEHIQVGDGLSDSLAEMLGNQGRIPLAVAEMEIAVQATHSGIERWTAEAQRFIADATLNGLFLSSSRVPDAGRVLIRYRAGTETLTESCSGILVDDRTVLTAAHCVCGLKEPWDFRDAVSCSAALPHVQISVFFPSAGLFQSSSHPEVHPNYQAPRSLANPAVSEVADLALIRLEERTEMSPAYVASPVVDERPLISSFGIFSFASLPVGWPLSEATRYASGVQQLSKHRSPLLGPGECGPLASADTFCTEYSDTIVTGAGADAGACGGDSGSPAYRPVSTDGRRSVIGLTTYFSQGSQFDCKSSRVTHFVRLDRYRDWIARSPAGDESASPGLACSDAILQGPAGFPMRIGPGRISFTTFDESGLARPKLTIGNVPSGQCEDDWDFGVATCELTTEQVVLPILYSGFAQVTICTRENGG